MERSAVSMKRCFPKRLMITDGVFSAYRRNLGHIPLLVFLMTALFFVGVPSAHALQLPSHLPPPSDPNSPAASASPNTGESSSVAPPSDSNSTPSTSGDSDRSPADKPADSGARARNPEPPPGTKPPSDEDVDADHNGPPPSGTGKTSPVARPAAPPSPGESSSAVPDATRDPESGSGTEPHTQPGRGAKSSAKQPSADSANAKDGPDYNPLHAEESVEIGTFYMNKGNLSAAADRFKYAIELQPNFAKPHLLLAKISEKQGDKAAAILYYEEYLAILPHAPDAAKIRSRIAELKKQLQP
jgi:hypothetical protein